MNTQHTPGPFLIRDQGDGKFTLEKITGDVRSVLATSYDATLAAEHGGTVAGNLRLWAAAPDLLAQLQECADWLARSARQDDREIAADTHAAIAAATGKGVA